VVIEPLMMIAGMEKKVINAFMEDIEALESGDKKIFTLYSSLEVAIRATDSFTQSEYIEKPTKHSVGFCYSLIASFSEIHPIHCCNRISAAFSF